MEFAELARDLAVELIRKSGVREWNDQDARLALAAAAVEMALAILGDGEEPLAVTAVFRQQVGTSKTLKSSGGSAAITLASLANGSYRESAKVDFGATFGQAYAVYIDAELAATPTAGNTLDLWANPSSSATAGTDNRGGCGGADAAYTGYSSNAAASAKQLQFIGSHVCTTQATATVQKSFVGIFVPTRRYNSFVLLNGSGASFHSSDSNCVITFEPLEATSEPS